MGFHPSDLTVASKEKFHILRLLRSPALPPEVYHVFLPLEADAESLFEVLDLPLLCLLLQSEEIAAAVFGRPIITTGLVGRPFLAGLSVGRKYVQVGTVEGSMTFGARWRQLSANSPRGGSLWNKM